MKELTPEQENYNKAIKKQRNPPIAWCGFCKKVTKRDENYKCVRCK